MRTLARIHAAGLLALGLTAAPLAAQAADVVAFGDEWASGAASALQTSLGPVPGSLTVADWGASGASAELYATTGTGTIAQALAANPDASWMWLSVGFKDLMDRYPLQNAAQIATIEETYLRTILGQAFASRPNLRVVMFGYDFTNYEQDLACQVQLATDFGPLATQLDVNDLMITAVGAAMQTVASEYPNVTYVDLYSTLQVATGTTADATQPSPASMMADCTHPNAAGYAALTDALVAAYWSPVVPTAAAQASATTICSGDIVTFNSLSSNNQGQVWRLDGTVTSTQPTWMASISGTSTVTVTLEAYNFAWTDTATITLTVANCADAGVADTGVVDAGAFDAGAADSGAIIDAGFPDTGVPPDTGVVDTGVPPDTGVVDAGFPDTGVPPDTGVVDTGVPPDTGVVDAGFPDTGIPPDTGVVDTGVPPDTGVVDAGFPDTGIPPDTGIVDTGIVDTGIPPDTGIVDTGIVDTGIPPDTGIVDTGIVDTGVVDTGIVDTGIVDTGIVDTGIPPDTGVEDTGVPDTGIVADTGVEDTGIVADAGTAPDTGVVADAGVAPDAGAPDAAADNVFDQIGISGDGCSCETERSEGPWAPSAAVAIGLMGLVGLRRRRR